MLQHHDNKYLNSPLAEMQRIGCALSFFCFFSFCLFFCVRVCACMIDLVFAGVAGDDEFWQSAFAVIFGKCFRGCSGVYCVAFKCNGVGGAKLLVESEKAEAAQFSI